jgi:hypothetical protein
MYIIKHKIISIVMKKILPPMLLQQTKEIRQCNVPFAVLEAGIIMYGK